MRGIKMKFSTTVSDIYENGKPVLLNAVFEHNIFGEDEIYDLSDIMPNLISVEEGEDGTVILKAFGVVEEETV